MDGMRTNPQMVLMKVAASTPPAGEDVAWHAMQPDSVMTALETRRSGLSEPEAGRRLEAAGLNSLPEGTGTGLTRTFLRQFASPLIYLLLAAGLLAMVIGDRWDAAFIFGVLLLNAVLGAVQEMKADASARALRSLVPQTALVRRDGVAREIESEQLVPGDIVELESGMRVTADMRLLEAQALQLDESLLTGESLPVSKDATAELEPSCPLADRVTLAHTGTAVVRGRAIGAVVATGTNTAIGRIGRSLEDVARSAAATPLIQRMAQLARQIAVAAVGLIICLAILLALQGEAWRDIAMLAIALAVSAIPEGLPIAVTVALSSAARRMAKKNVIVRALPAVEGLGSCTLIASDKTGTLTVNRLTVERAMLSDGAPIDRASWLGESAPEDVQALGRAAALCNEAGLTEHGIALGDAVDVALLTFAGEIGQDVPALLQARKLAIIPYEPAQRYAAVEVQLDGVPRLVVKGAPETVVAMCADVHPDTIQIAEQLARDGYRVLALAEGSGTVGEGPLEGRLQRLSLRGFVGLVDPLRPEAEEAVRRCAAAGIGVRMVTGDHPATALAIASKLGLAERADEVVTGAALAACLEDALAFREHVMNARVFARIEPAQKLAIVRALQEAGEIVAVTGDGVNDGPALQAAHVGVAMGKGGTDVARGAADLVLADDNFASIVAGIEEGRITFGNVRKIVIFVLATGVAEIGMFLAALAAGLPMPLTPVQLLWLNLVTNGVQDVTLGFGRGDGDEMHQPPRRKLTSLIDRQALILMLPGAALMAGIAVWLLSRELDSGAPIEQARNSVLLMVVLFQNVFLIGIRHLRLPVWRVRSENPWLFLGIALALALHVGAMNLPPLQGLLDVAPVSSDVLRYCLVSAASILFVTEVAKRWAFRASPP